MKFETLSLREEKSILHITINNPPINLFNAKMVEELFMLSGALRQREDIRVVVFDSADPDFFIAHFDLEDLAKSVDDPSKQSRYPEINVMQSVALNWQSLPQITMAKINGRCRGAGLEFVMALDMRFTSDNSQLCLPESIVGFLACGGGATRAFLAAGPARALEFLLSGRDFSGEEAQRYNLVNRALPAKELDAYVQRLAEQLSKRSPEVVAYHRKVFEKFTAPMENSFFEALAAENEGMRASMASEAMRDSIAKHLKMGQSRETGIELPEMLQRLVESE